MQVQVSFGEALDKLTILEIKQQYISNPQQLQEIQKEIDALQSAQECRKSVEFLFGMLKFVNQRIWDLTNVVKQMSVTHSEFAPVCLQIFDHNQYRFRVKNMMNHTLCRIKQIDGLKEQKSYAQTQIRLLVHEFTCFRHITKLFQASCLYDRVVLVFENLSRVNSTFMHHLSELLCTPNFAFENFQGDSKEYDAALVDWKQHAFAAEYEHHFDPKLPPIAYVNGGLLGDFIHSLGVCSVNYWQTGCKAIVYISNSHGDPFAFGIQEAYQFTKDLVQQQPYVCQYEIYANQTHSLLIDLSAWRRRSDLLYRVQWNVVYDTCYNMQGWGKYPWLEVIPTEQQRDELEHVVLFNCSKYRISCLSDVNVSHLLSLCDLQYLCMKPADCDTFCASKNVQIKPVQAHSALELCQLLVACKGFVGNLSSPLAFAIALHKRCVGLIGNAGVDTVHMKNLPIPNYHWYERASECVQDVNAFCSE
jgi:hypothetical protein